MKSRKTKGLKPTHTKTKKLARRVKGVGKSPFSKPTKNMKSY